MLAEIFLKVLMNTLKLSKSVKILLNYNKWDMIQSINDYAN